MSRKLRGREREYLFKTAKFSMKELDLISAYMDAENVDFNAALEDLVLLGDKIYHEQFQQKEEAKVNYTKLAPDAKDIQ